MLNSEQIKPILEAKYNRDDWYKILRQNFNVNTLRENPIVKVSVTQNDFDAVAYELGTFDTSNGHLVGIYEVDVPAVKQIYRNKVGLRNLLNNVYKTDVDAALIVFTQGDKWRFSYVSEVTTRNSETGEREKLKTDPKRYTYLFGKDEKAKTAADRFADIQQEDVAVGRGITLKSLQDTFNVEKMSKEFFDKYRKHYGAFLTYLIGENEEGKVSGIAAEQFKTVFNADDKKARDFVKKMLGRIVFLYFLEKKGWLGVPERENWGKGDPDFLRNLFYNSKDQEGFYPLVLEPLFHNTLNQVRDGDFFAIDNNLFNGIEYNKYKIPFLNGGLFEPEAYNTDFLVFPAELFKNLFVFFDRYNFTVHEDSPHEHTVAVDPEMLGHIFENLLEDNKDKGAFYTPKEIVHYMCQESLIEYLCTKCEAEADENLRAGIEGFIKYQELGGIAEHDETILQALRDVKICDPAIGSGAFPMGVLLEIFHSVETLYYEFDATKRIWDLEDGWNPAKVKLSIIENSIYGVDIEPGAVDIARLRFWLSLVVDEVKPQPLPNLDYKIVVGNSLLSKFEEDVIDIDWEVNARTEATKKLQLQIQENLKKLFAKQKRFFSYKGDKKTLQADIRDLKIDVLISQLELDKYKYDQTTAKTGSLFGETKKETVKTTEIALQLAGYNTAIKKLRALRAHPEKPLMFFDWKLDFSEVLNPMLKENERLNSSIGFDIVIGNPPYVDSENMVNNDPEFRELLKNRFTTTKGNWDLFVPFIENGVSLNSENGVFCFIIPNKLLSATYTIDLRKHLSCFNILEIRDYSTLNVFKTANVYPITFLLRKTDIKKNVTMTTMESVTFFKAQNLINAQTFYKDIFWDKYFFNADYVKILIKIANQSTLGNIAGLTILGAATVNEAYLIKEKLHEHTGEKNVKKLINTGTIDKWTALWGTRRTQYIKSAYIFPVILNSDLNNINPSRLLQAGSPKIIIAGMSTDIEAFLDIDGEYLAGKSTTIILDTLDNLKIFTAILNSDIASFFVKLNYHSLKMSGGYLNINNEIIKSIPIPILPTYTRKALISLVESLLFTEVLNDARAHLQLKINTFIYKLYHFNFEEIKIINPDFPFTEKEYHDLKIE